LFLLLFCVLVFSCLFWISVLILLDFTSGKPKGFQLCVKLTLSRVEVGVILFPILQGLSVPLLEGLDVD